MKTKILSLLLLILIAAQAKAEPFSQAKKIEPDEFLKAEIHQIYGQEKSFNTLWNANISKLLKKKGLTTEANDWVLDEIVANETDGRRSINRENRRAAIKIAKEKARKSKTEYDTLERTPPEASRKLSLHRGTQGFTFEPGMTLTPEDRITFGDTESFVINSPTLKKKFKITPNDKTLDIVEIRQYTPPPAAQELKQKTQDNALTKFVKRFKSESTNSGRTENPRKPASGAK